MNSFSSLTEGLWFRSQQRGLVLSRTLAPIETQEVGGGSQIALAYVVDEHLFAF